MFLNRIHDIHHVPKAWYYKPSFQMGDINRIRKFSDLHSINTDKTNLKMAQDRSDYYFNLHRNAKSR